MNSLKKTLLLAASACLMSTATAYLDESSHPFIAPGSGDVRSPCPGLNALANHGILPRDGKGIDLDILAAATLTGFNLGRDASDFVGSVGLKSSQTGNASTFDLDNLNTHQIIEHDGSMSRADIYWGDNHSFNESAWDRTLANWGDDETITFKIAASERNARFAYGMATNPQFNATFGNSGSLLEYSLLLSVFGDVVEGNANKTMVKYWFENERLPFSLGWQPPSSPITVATAQTMAAKIAAIMLGA